MTDPTNAVDRRMRELREAEERAQRPRETDYQRAQRNTQDWCSWVDQRIAEGVNLSRESLLEAVGKALAVERESRDRELDAAIAEAKRAFEAKLEALEQRLKAVPGKLPVAKTWRPETVVYQAEFVTHDGTLWQAKCDTAQAPGGADWICVARAGRDGADAPTLNVRGTYDARKTYQHLDVVALDGASFVAKRDDPGICTGDGWQLMAQQGKRGQRGERGPVGPKGDKGEPVMPGLVSTKIDEHYNLVILRKDNSLEIIPLREAFERYDEETRP